MSISAVVNTLNAAATLDEALGSLTPWVDEIVVVDMHSADGTRAIAERHGARVLLHEPTGYVEPARAWSIEQATGDWVVLLDADEVIPRGVSRRLREVAARGEADVVEIPEINYFFGKPVLHGGWSPDDQRHPRFFRRGMLDCPPLVHAAPAVVPDARVLAFQYRAGLFISHFAYVTIEEFVQRTDRYTSVDIESPPRQLLHQVRHTLAEVRRRAFDMRGIRDGSRGISLALLMGMYEWMLWLKRVQHHAPTKHRLAVAVVRRGMYATVAALKLVERLRWPSADAIRRAYLEEARRLVAEYDAELQHR